MPVNKDDIKKMPDAEKLMLFDHLLDNIDEELINQFLETEEDLILRERIEKYRSGTMQCDTWENVEKRLMDQLKQK
ncbi:MAG TPA: addiction module protein [Chitinophagaceae bacterium]